QRRASAWVSTGAGKMSGSAFSRRASARRFASSRVSDIFMGGSRRPNRTMVPCRRKAILSGRMRGRRQGRAIEVAARLQDSPMSDELIRLDANTIVARLKRGEVTPHDLLDALEARIAAVN